MATAWRGRRIRRDVSQEPAQVATVGAVATQAISAAMALLRQGENALREAIPRGQEIAGPATGPPVMVHSARLAAQCVKRSARMRANRSAVPARAADAKT